MAPCGQGSRVNQRGGNDFTAISCRGAVDPASDDRDVVGPTVRHVAHDLADTTRILQDAAGFFKAFALRGVHRIFAMRETTTWH